MFPKIGIIFVWLNNSVAIKKGNKLGSTEFAHNSIPDFAACKLEFEKIKRLIVNNVNNIGSNNFFSETTKNLFT